MVVIINFSFDAMRRYEIPEMVLCNPDKSEICMIKGQKDTKLSIKWQSCCELTFTVYSEYNGFKPEYYDKLEKNRLIHVLGFGYFVIQNYDQTFENKVNKKEITAYSAEYLLNFKGINLTFVTTPASATSTKVISKSYKFYDLINPEGTLLYELVSACPQWKIGYVSMSLMDKRRSFDETDEGLYGFLCNTVAESYEAIFIFDYENYTISAYDKDEAVKNTQIVLTFDNLLKNAHLEELSSDTYTVLNVSGADTLSIASINPTGSKKIFKFDYYTGDLDPNSKRYYENYNDWITDSALKKKVLDWEAEVKRQMYLTSTDPTYKQSYGYLVKQRKIFYKLLLTQKSVYTDQKTYYESASQRMSTYQGDESEIAKKNYAIQQQRQQAFESNMVAVQNGGNFLKVNDDGTTSVEKVISNNIDDNNPYSATWSITALQNKIDEIDNQRDVIINKYAFEKYFTQAEIDVLEPYIREAEYSDSSFIVTDTMKITDCSNGDTWVETTNGVKQIKDLEPSDTIIDETYIALQLLDAGYSKFDEIYEPSFTFTANSVNFLFSQQFENFAHELNFGAILNVELKDGFWVYPCFQTVDIDFDNPTDFSLGFSNRIRLNDSEWTWSDLHNDTTNAVSSVTSLLGSTASSTTNGTIDKVTNYMANTLNAANQAIQATKDNEFVFGSYGLRGRKLSKEAGSINGYSPKQIWINNNLICFTADGWKTTRLAIGDAGNGQYGIVADYVVGTLIAGNTLTITNGNGSFTVDGDKATLTNCYLEVTRSTPDASGNIPKVKISPNEISLNNAVISLDGTNDKSIKISPEEISIKNGSINISGDNKSVVMSPDGISISNGTIQVQTSDGSFYLAPDGIRMTNGSVSVTSGDFTTSLDPTRGLVIHRNSNDTDMLYTTTGGELYLTNVTGSGSFKTVSGNSMSELNSGEISFYRHNNRVVWITNENDDTGRLVVSGPSGSFVARSFSSDTVGGAFAVSNPSGQTVQCLGNGDFQSVTLGCSSNCNVGGNLNVDGQKNRIVDTSFGRVRIAAYETPKPAFGDYGIGVCDENGECLITLDPRFAETVSNKQSAIWQITPYSNGNMWVEELDYSAIIHGNSNQKFAWFVTIPQRDYEDLYAEDNDIVEPNSTENRFLNDGTLAALQNDINEKENESKIEDLLLGV